MATLEATREGNANARRAPLNLPPGQAPATVKTYSLRMNAMFVLQLGGIKRNPVLDLSDEGKSVT